MSEIHKNKSLRALIVAEHASSVFGGEALIPYQYFRCLREIDVDVHMLVHERTRSELQKAFPNDTSRLHFVVDSLVNVWCFKIGKLLPDRLAVFTAGTISHLDTQIRQRRVARHLVSTFQFDVIHEPIPVSPKLPSVMFGLSVPVIIGPVNGGMDYPPNYNITGRVERAIISWLRWTSGFWNHLFPGKLQAALILVANERAYNALPDAVRGRRTFEFVENGVDLDRFSQNPGRSVRATFNIIYVGRLVDWKRVDLLIEAGRKLIGKLDFQIHIVGDGALRSHLENQVKELSLRHQVRFHGRLSQSAVAALLRSSDVMVLPSMRECGGAVVLEAMASGIPVIATNWGGPVDYITDDTGILIPPDTPEKFARELANSILLLATNPELRQKMGEAGRNRAERLYDWRVKARALLEIYEAVVTNSEIPETAKI